MIYSLNDEEGGTYVAYRVHMRSAPGKYTMYEGHVDVWATSKDEAKEAAVDKLRATSFPERKREAWLFDRVEQQ